MDPELYQKTKDPNYKHIARTLYNVATAFSYAGKEDPMKIPSIYSVTDAMNPTITGTVNLDYRSLFLHFECNSIFYKADILQALKADYIATLSECREVTLESLNHGKWHKFVDNLLRLLAPLL
ncbi:MAG: hypothetical protein K5897_02915 [Eubacterium sp.]|nr:hypothetical protein [Eubacterium sp.]